MDARAGSVAGVLLDLVGVFPISRKKLASMSFQTIIARQQHTTKMAISIMTLSFAQENQMSTITV